MGEIIEHCRHGKIDCQAYGYHQHIAKIESDKANEQQEYQHCESCAEIYLIELAANAFGCVI